MNHFYYILYDLESIRKVKPIKRKICCCSDKIIINAFKTLLDIM